MHRCGKLEELQRIVISSLLDVSSYIAIAFEVIGVDGGLTAGRC